MTRHNVRTAKSEFDGAHVQLPARHRESADLRTFIARDGAVLATDPYLVFEYSIAPLQLASQIHRAAGFETVWIQ